LALENVLAEIRADALQAGLNPVGLQEGGAALTARRQQHRRACPAGAFHPSQPAGTTMRMRVSVKRRKWSAPGRSGAASPCKRLNPKTGEIIEVIGKRNRLSSNSKPSHPTGEQT
jgi:hypothetical protein